MKVPGDPMGSQLYGTPSPFEKNVVKNIPKDLPQYLSASGRTPLQDLDGIITPNGLFYERHHGGVPAIDPAQHRLMLHGLVERPLIFTVDDIKRFPSTSQIHFLECSANPGYKKPFGKTASDLVGLLSCAEWTGVSMKLVLQEAGLRPEAKWVIAEGADAARHEAQHSDREMSRRRDDRVQPEWRAAAPATGLSAATDPARLRRQHEREVAKTSARHSQPAYSREETSKYTDLMPDGTAREFSFLHGGEVHHPAALWRAQRLSRQRAFVRSLALPGADAARSAGSTCRSMTARTGRRRSCRSRS